MAVSTFENSRGQRIQSRRPVRLLEAIKAGKIAEVRRLLEEGSEDPNGIVNGITPLIAACLISPKMTSTLLACNAVDPNLGLGKATQTPLMLALGKGKYEAALVLCENPEVDLNHAMIKDRHPLTELFAYAPLPLLSNLPVYPKIVFTPVQLFHLLALVCMRRDAERLRLILVSPLLTYEMITELHLPDIGSRAISFLHMECKKLAGRKEEYLETQARLFGPTQTELLLNKLLEKLEELLVVSSPQ